MCVFVAQFDDELEEVPSTHMPHLLSTTTFVEATIGETVEFPCAVDDLGTVELYCFYLFIFYKYVI